jgi:hypothetical protein
MSDDTASHSGERYVILIVSNPALNTRRYVRLLNGRHL